MRRVLLAIVTAPAVAGDAAAIATAAAPSFSCSVPGHEDAGMHGTLIVI